MNSRITGNARMVLEEIKINTMYELLKLMKPEKDY